MRFFNHTIVESQPAIQSASQPASQPMLYPNASSTHAKHFGKQILRFRTNSSSNELCAQSANQQIGRPANEQFSQSANQPINQPISKSAISYPTSSE